MSKFFFLLAMVIGARCVCLEQRAPAEDLGSLPMDKHFSIASDQGACPDPIPPDPGNPLPPSPHRTFVEGWPWPDEGPWKGFLERPPLRYRGTGLCPEAPVRYDENGIELPPDGSDYPFLLCGPSNYKKKFQIADLVYGAV